MVSLLGGRNMSRLNPRRSDRLREGVTAADGHANSTSPSHYKGVGQGQLSGVGNHATSNFREVDNFDDRIEIWHK